MQRECESLRTARLLALGRAALLERLLGRERSRVRVLEEIVKELRTQLEEQERELEGALG